MLRCRPLWKIKAFKRHRQAAETVRICPAVPATPPKRYPEDDIKYVLEESGAYDEEIERMTENGTYEEFVRKVKEHIDWNNLQGRMIQAENEAISAAIDAIINKSFFSPKLGYSGRWRVTIHCCWYCPLYI